MILYRVWLRVDIQINKFAAWLSGISEFARLRNGNYYSSCLNPRDKAIKNRRKFINRSKANIKQAVKEAIDSGNIADIEKGKIRIKAKGISNLPLILIINW